MSSAGKVIFQKSLKELRIILCQTSASSKGARDFVEKHYVSLKSANPNTPILIRECSGVLPKIYARYDHGKELNADIADENAEKVLQRVSEFSTRSP